MYILMLRYRSNRNNNKTRNNNNNGMLQKTNPRKKNNNKNHTKKMKKMTDMSKMNYTLMRHDTRNHHRTDINKMKNE